MIEVTLDVPYALFMFDDLVAAALPDIAELCYNRLTGMVQRDLHTGAVDYNDALRLVKRRVTAAGISSGGERVFASIILSGSWLADAIEHGWRGGDMKPGILRSPKAHQGKDGPYMVIPFRHGGPGSSGRSFGKMGGPEQSHGMSLADAEMLGKSVQRAASKLKKSFGDRKTGMVWGDRLGAGVGGAKPLRNRTSGYEHQTDVYAGMVKLMKTYESSSGAEYRTFRTVSVNSDPASWQHPGIIRHDFFGRLQSEIPDIVGREFAGMVRGLGGPA